MKIWVGLREHWNLHSLHSLRKGKCLLTAGAPSEHLCPAFFQKKWWRRVPNPRFWLFRVLAEMPPQAMVVTGNVLPAQNQTIQYSLCSAGVWTQQNALMQVFDCDFLLFPFLCWNQSGQTRTTPHHHLSAALSHLDGVPAVNKYRVLSC